MPNVRLEQVAGEIRVLKREISELMNVRAYPDQNLARQAIQAKVAEKRRLEAEMSALVNLQIKQQEAR